MFVDIFQNKSCNWHRLNESPRVFLGNKMKLNIKNKKSNQGSVTAGKQLISRHRHGNQMILPRDEVCNSCKKFELQHCFNLACFKVVATKCLHVFSGGGGANTDLPRPLSLGGVPVWRISDGQTCFSRIEA